MMNFERHIDPKDAMCIGKAALALRLTDVEFMNRTKSKGNWWIQRLEEAQILQLLQFLSTSSSRVRDCYSCLADLKFLMEAKGSIIRICNIWELQGKTIHFGAKVYHIKEKLDLS
jgi:hypothetical protein